MAFVEELTSKLQGHIIRQLEHCILGDYDMLGQSTTPACDGVLS